MRVNVKADNKSPPTSSPVGNLRVWLWASSWRGASWLCLGSSLIPQPLPSGGLCQKIALPCHSSCFCSIWIRFFWSCPDEKPFVLGSPKAAEIQGQLRVVVLSGKPQWTGVARSQREEIRCWAGCWWCDFFSLQQAGHGHFHAHLSYSSRMCD